MNLDEVVGEIIERCGCRVILHLPAKSIPQAGITAHRCANRSVLALHERRGDMLRIGPSAHFFHPTPAGTSPENSGYQGRQKPGKFCVIARNHLCAESIFDYI
jgi:hypothetical protein